MYSSDYSKQPNSFELYSSDFALATIDDDIGFVLTKKSVNSIEVFNMLDCNYSFENTYFSNANLPHDFNINTLRDDEILLSYNLARYMEVHVGDSVQMINNTTIDDDDTTYKDVVVKDFTIVGIMKTKYPYDSVGEQIAGTALIKVDSLNSKFISYVQFLKEGDTYSPDASIIQKETELQVPIHNIFNGPTVAATGLLMPLMAILLIYLIIFREMKFVLQRYAKKSEILYILGVERGTIISYLWLQQLAVLVVSVIASAILMKYILFEMYLGIYVEPLVLVCIMTFQFLLGMLASYLCFRQIKKHAHKQTTMEHIL